MTLIYTLNLRTKLEKTMNKELEKLHDCLCINRLSLNITKTNFVIGHSFNKPKAHVTILINKEVIDEVKHVKYLGILIDSQLTFKYRHIDKLNKKVYRAIDILYKLRPFVTSKILSNAYNVITYPSLLYGIEVWGNTNITLLDSIHLTEKNCSNGNL